MRKLKMLYLGTTDLVRAWAGLVKETIKLEDENCFWYFSQTYFRGKNAEANRDEFILKTELTTN